MITLTKERKKKKKLNYGCQPILLSTEGELGNILEYLCSEANKLTNCAIYLGRQLWFKVHGYLNKYSLNAEYKGYSHYRSLHSQAAQQTLLTVFESFRSFYELDKMYRDGEIEQKPRLPHYRKKGGLAVVTYPKQALKLINEGEIRIPLGKSVKAWFCLQSFTIPMPSNLRFEDIKEFRIVPRNQCFYAEFVYTIPKASLPELNPNKALGIDPGINNWLSCVSNVGNSFIVDGRKVKSLNQWYNKRVSTLKEGKTQGYWDEQLAHITEKR
ncbi:MAG: RNA-guided endonuclease InsQ/TnpB family protein, partial [Xenococcaceae cyanobacterium]